LTKGSTKRKSSKKKNPENLTDNQGSLLRIINFPPEPDFLEAFHTFKRSELRF
jgi:hypothetical protein